jgi:hypothetical protein
LSESLWRIYSVGPHDCRTNGNGNGRSVTEQTESKGKGKDKKKVTNVKLLNKLQDIGIAVDIERLMSTK